MDDQSKCKTMDDDNLARVEHYIYPTALDKNHLPHPEHTNNETTIDDTNLTPLDYCVDPAPRNQTHLSELEYCYNETALDLADVEHLDYNMHQNIQDSYSMCTTSGWELFDSVCEKYYTGN